MIRGNAHRKYELNNWEATIYDEDNQGIIRPILESILNRVR